MKCLVIVIDYHQDGCENCYGIMGETSKSIANGNYYAYVYANINSGKTGGSQAHNNLQPYITVYMYKRVS